MPRTSSPRSRPRFWRCPRSPTVPPIGSCTASTATPYVATYYNAAGEWILQGLAGNPYNIPLGGMIEFSGTTAPNSSFILPFGQELSRTTYAAYFAMVGTTYGAGSGGTTFNVIDKRGRVSAGKDDMGGSVSNRITSGGSGITGTTLGAAGGSETHTLMEAQLAVHSHGGSIGSARPSFTGSQRGMTTTSGSSNAYVDEANQTGGDATSGFDFTNMVHAHSIASAGSGTAHNNVQPTVIVNYILRVL